ncbi:hypothetical protein [Pectinatus frisingensis]|uniref:hypothetical protein n=1 Tax=Pectinatus frisingensis TaxID=865 RepID=UPI003D8034B7
MLTIFLGAALLIISVSVFLIYHFTSFCRLGLNLKAILLAAVLAFAVNFLLWPVEKYITIPYYVIIILTVLTTSLAATLYNKKLLVTTSCITETVTKSSITTVIAPLSIPDTVSNELSIPAMLIRPQRLPAIIINPTAPKYLPVVLDKTDKYFIFAIGSISTTNKFFLFFHNDILLPALSQSTQKNFISSPSVKRYYNLPVPLAISNIYGMALYLLDSEKIKITFLFNNTRSIDDLLNYIYDEKEHGHYACALYALKKGLRKYNASSYAPFICIEMSNIYKKLGLYTNAIALLRTALRLPTVTISVNVQQEFIRQIRYLQDIITIPANNDLSIILSDRSYIGYFETGENYYSL